MVHITVYNLFVGCFFLVIKTPDCPGSSLAGDNEKTSLLSYNSYVVCKLHQKELRRFYHQDIPMTYTVYHIRNGTVGIISFSHQNIEERHSMSQGGLMSAECYGSYANGNM